MAQSWIRLRQGGNIQTHDIILLKHEYLEATLMKKYKYSYEKAHEQAEKRYGKGRRRKMVRIKMAEKTSDTVAYEYFPGFDEVGGSFSASLSTGKLLTHNKGNADDEFNTYFGQAYNAIRKAIQQNEPLPETETIA